MKSTRSYLFERTGRTLESEVDDELRFHLEMLEQDCGGRGMTPAAAKVASRERFGDFERIRRQCLKITRRKHPVTRTLKSALIGMLLAGVLLRIMGTTPQYDRLADLSIAIAVLGHVFLYLREQLPASFRLAKSINVIKVK